MHSQLLPPLALLVFYRPVSMLQTSKYSTTFLGREYRFPVPHQNMDLPPASGTPLGHPLSFRGPGSRLSLQTLSLICLFSVLVARMWEGRGHYRSQDVWAWPGGVTGVETVEDQGIGWGDWRRTRDRVKA